jgi:colanic acid biosynthesis glycosyl transferase WcaI
MSNRSTKFLIISQFFPPETAAGANRIVALAQIISRRFPLEVITLQPGYPDPEVFSEIDTMTTDEEFPFPILRLSGLRPHRRSLFIRGLGEIFMSLRVGVQALRHDFDILIVSTPSMFLGPMAYLMARLKSKKLVWDVRDLTWRYSQETIDLGKINILLSKLIETIMRAIIKRADLVVGATEGVSNLLIKEHGVPPEHLVTIMNGVSREFFNDLGNLDEVSTSDKLPTLLHVGLIGYNQGLRILLDVAEILPGIQIVLVGDGPEKGKISADLKEKDLENLVLQPYSADRNILNTYYREAHILFAQARDKPILNTTMIGSKVFEYMATGKPMVYAGKGLAVEFLSPIGCAEFAIPEDAESIAVAIERLLDRPHQAMKMGDRGRQFIEDNLIREDLMNRLLDEIEERFC